MCDLHILAIQMCDSHAKVAHFGHTTVWLYNTHEWGMPSLCHPHGWFMSHIWMSHVTHMNNFVSHTSEWVTSMNESLVWMRHTYEWVTPYLWIHHPLIVSHTWIIHVTHVNDCGRHTHIGRAMLTLVQQSKTRFFMFLEDDWILPFHQAHWQPIIGAVCCSVLQCGTVCCRVFQCAFSCS